MSSATFDHMRIVPDIVLVGHNELKTDNDETFERGMSRVSTPKNKKIIKDRQFGKRTCNLLVSLGELRQFEVKSAW